MKRPLQSKNKALFAQSLLKIQKNFMDNKNIEQTKGKVKNKIEVVDANKLDKKVPRNLIIKFGNNWYILKAGLEWKASQLYGGGNYSIDIEIVERSADYCLAKAIFLSKDGTRFVNFGEASKANVSNSKMHSQLLHLAITRAECRVLRMATAAGYMSYEEMDFSNGVSDSKLPALENGDSPADDAQLKTLKTLGADMNQEYTRQQAAQKIKELAMKKKGGSNHA